MGGGTPCDESKVLSVQKTAFLQKYALLRSFCALHAVLLGACAGALVMAVTPPPQRLSNSCTSYTPDAVVAEPACPHADLHDWHGRDAQHRLCGVHATARRRFLLHQACYTPFKSYKPSL